MKSQRKNSGNDKKNQNNNQKSKKSSIRSDTSSTESKSVDLNRTNKLREALKLYNVFESKEEHIQRIRILSKLNSLVKQWIQDKCITGNMASNVNQVGGKIYTYGSYRLGVHHKGADIDALCVAPKYIKRKDYFTSFFMLLKDQPEITDLNCELTVEEAFIPVIKMNFNSIKINMLFARLALAEVPDSLDLRDDMLLEHLDERCIQSLNGCRIAIEILKLIPNMENFRLTTRAIKLWAKRQGIYSNLLGYLGGISWTILVARVCRLYPDAIAATLINKFFLVFSNWKWPEPVLLKFPGNVNLDFPVWDPKFICDIEIQENTSDKSHLMPIITPAYPQQNSAANVSVSTLKIIQEAFEKGVDITNEIVMGKAEWYKLFEPPNFFSKYREYIVLLASSPTVDDQLEWCRHVESKIRHLISVLERNPVITLAHINPEPFTPLHKEPTKECSMWFIGLIFENEDNINNDFSSEINSFVDVIEESAEQLAFKNGMTIEAKRVEWKDLTNYVSSHFLKEEK